MSTFFFVLLAIIVVCALTFLCALLWRSLDDADFWLKVFSAVLGTLIFVVGFPALVIGHLSGKEQAKEILELKAKSADATTAQQRVEIDLATQQERAAKAEIALQELVRRGIGRTIDDKKLVAALKGKFTGVKVEILYKPEDGEAYWLAIQLYRALGKDGVGWDVAPPKKLPLSRSDIPSEHDFVGEGGYVLLPPRRDGGVYVVHPPDDVFPGNPTKTAGGAIAIALYEQQLTNMGREDPAMAINSCIIVVGEQPRIH